MFLAILIVHVMVSIFLVFVVLLQSGRGAELGAAFGGMGQTTFGRGQSTFITKFTTSLAVVFMATSLSLAFISSERPTRSVIKPEPVAAEAPQPAASTPQAGQTPVQPSDGAQSEAPAQEPLEQSKAPPNPNPTNRQ